MHCLECNEKDNITIIPVYKRNWILCNECGTATSGEEKNNKLLSLLPYDFLKRNHGEEDIYDYFVSPAHEDVSKKNYANFMKLFSKYITGIENKNIIDISGGSGHFLSNFKAKYSLLTEINDKAIDFARDKLKLNAVKFNFNTQKIDELIETECGSKKFDIVMLNACLMFCKDLDSFVSSLKKILSKDGVIIAHANVEPTIGVMARTQFDDFSYLVLRRKNSLRKHFESDFDLLEESSYEDIYPEYVTSHDLNRVTRFLKLYYTEKAISKLVKNPKAFANFRYKDRHVFYQVYKFKS